MQQQKYIALTFDDGANYTTTVPMLDVLEKYNVVASFFVCGKNLNDTTKAILQRMSAMGCEVANHSYSHANMAELSPKDILQEVEDTSRLILEYTGKLPKFFRPPYIALNQTMFDTIGLPFIEGYGCTDWEDSVSVEERVDGIVNHSQDGNIILLHDLEGNSKTVQAIDIAIPKLLSSGYTFVTVSQLFELNHIEPLLHSNAIYSNVNAPRICAW